MAVHIRLRRIGKRPKGRAYFRVTVFDERKARDSKFIEEVGFYNPVTGEAKIKKERVEYWIKNGAQLSETVKSLMHKLSKEV
ncbi:MAG: 30S ribosomal protein S16 [Candidatus Omnitrophica bacterium]|nr:30S ribosomal protein S16 [Candidatus Omnitrophota bacterium]